MRTVEDFLQHWRLPDGAGLGGACNRCKMNIPRYIGDEHYDNLCSTCRDGALVAMATAEQRALLEQAAQMMFAMRDHVQITPASDWGGANVDFGFGSSVALAMWREVEEFEQRIARALSDTEAHADDEGASEEARDDD